MQTRPFFVEGLFVWQKEVMRDGRRVYGDNASDVLFHQFLDDLADGGPSVG